MRTRTEQVLLGLLVLMAVAVGVLVATGGSSTVKPLAPVRGHPCSAGSFYMQCVGPATPALVAPGGKGAPLKQGTFRTLPGSVTASGASFGVDFAWSRPPAYQAKAGGARFGAGYLSGSSKDFFNASSYRANGLGVVFVWETYANRSLAGYNAGYSDAYNATHEAQRLGFQTGHIDFATDFDSTNYGRAFVPYYQGAAAWDRRAGFTTGAYGGLHTVQTLCALGVTTANWQTLAWSYGYWAAPSCAPLRQTAINDYWHGFSVDYDQAVASYYGQSNGAPTPPKPRTVCFGRHTQHSATCRRVQAQVRHWAGAQAASLRVYRAIGCRTLARTKHYLGVHAPHGKTLLTVRRQFTARRCPLFSGRAAYFGHRVSATERSYT